ncbi:YitT family protein [Oceanispirochaeta sp.]|jgi:uncharacterized membrane-anchored protein YitT (DUF2179 family)|uniref:YitT family protein n=1 Tax=Oceanispirochaeta sp. TaxID=2035350 RepID=UPI0026329901|nr:YitT family protein [Oceanispirochaeta sp.]MDA3955599.1 YitT family protein [Oceanispirochaeta sp.]
MTGRVKSFFTEIPSYLKITAACLIMALGMSLFLIPNKIAAGGLSGIGIVLFHLFNFPVGVSVLILNIPLFLLSWRLLGTSFGVKTLFATVVFSVFVDVTAFLTPMTDDLLLSVLFGGALVGLGLGLIFRENATTGGTDLAAKIIHRIVPFISIGQVLLIIDALVVVLAALVFRQYDLALYASVAIFITARIIDVVVIGINYSKAAYIISLQSGRISSRIMDELSRGVTELKGRGMFTGMDRPVLLCVLRRRDVPLMKKIVLEEDPEAFIFISDVREVLGEGFSFEQKR